MLNTITITDEVFGSNDMAERQVPRAPLEWNASDITIADLIRFRVEAELDRREDLLNTFIGKLPQQGVDVASNCTLEKLNSVKTFARSFRGTLPEQEVDADQRERNISIALKAFTSGHYLLIVNGRQATDLAETVPLRENNDALFLRIIPLKGG